MKRVATLCVVLLLCVGASHAVQSVHAADHARFRSTDSRQRSLAPTPYLSATAPNTTASNSSAPVASNVSTSTNTTAKPVPAPTTVTPAANPSGGGPTVPVTAVVTPAPIPVPAPAPAPLPTAGLVGPTISPVAVPNVSAVLPPGLATLLNPPKPPAVKTTLVVKVDTFKNGCDLKWKTYLADDANELQVMFRTCDLFIRTKRREFCSAECAYRVRAFKTLMAREINVLNCVSEDRHTTNLLDAFAGSLCGSDVQPTNDADLAYDSDGNPITFSGRPDMDIGVNFGHVNNHPAPDTIPRELPTAANTTDNITVAKPAVKRLAEVRVTGTKKQVLIGNRTETAIIGDWINMYVDGRLTRGLAAIINGTYGLYHNHTFVRNPNSPVDICVPNPCADGLKCVTGTCEVSPCFNYTCVNATQARIDAILQAGGKVIPTTGSYDYLGREILDFNHSMLSAPLSEEQISAIPLPPELTKQDMAACTGTLGPLQVVREGCALFLANNTLSSCPRSCAVALRLFRYAVDMSSEVAKCLILPEFSELINQFSNTACSPARLGLLFKPTIPIRDPLKRHNPAYRILHPEVAPVPRDYQGSVGIFDAGGRKVEGYQGPAPVRVARSSAPAVAENDTGIVLGGGKEFLLPTEGFVDGGNGLERFEPLKPYDPYEEKGYCKGKAGKVVVDEKGNPVYCKPRPAPIQVDERGRPVYPDVLPSGRIRYDGEFKIDAQGRPVYDKPPARGQVPFQAPFGKVANALSGDSSKQAEVSTNSQLPSLSQSTLRSAVAAASANNGLEPVLPTNASASNSTAANTTAASNATVSKNSSAPSNETWTPNIVSKEREPDDGSDILLKAEELELFAHHFEHKLLSLHQAGYTDKIKNIRLLVKFHGDINRVMAAQDPSRFPNVVLDASANDDDPVPTEPITRLIVEKIVNTTVEAVVAQPNITQPLPVNITQPQVVPLPLPPKPQPSNEIPVDILEAAFSGDAQ